MHRAATAEKEEKKKAAPVKKGKQVGASGHCFNWLFAKSGASLPLSYTTPSHLQPALNSCLPLPNPSTGARVGRRTQRQG